MENNAILNAAFDIEGLDIDRLLASWRWLIPNPMRLIARNAFGDLFLADSDGSIHWLDTAEGSLKKAAESETDFQADLKLSDRQELYLAVEDTRLAASNGFVPKGDDCIAFDVPLAGTINAAQKRKAYILDLYKHHAFLGDFHHQIAAIPDGTSVQLKVI